MWHSGTAAVSKQYGRAKVALDVRCCVYFSGVCAYRHQFPSYMGKKTVVESTIDTCHWLRQMDPVKKKYKQALKISEIADYLQDLEDCSEEDLNDIEVAILPPDEVDEVTDIEEGPDDDMGVIPVSDVAGQVEFSCTIDQTVYKRIAGSARSPVCDSILHPYGRCALCELPSYMIMRGIITILISHISISDCSGFPVVDFSDPPSCVRNELDPRFVRANGCRVRPYSLSKISKIYERYVLLALTDDRRRSLETQAQSERAMLGVSLRDKMVNAEICRRTTLTELTGSMLRLYATVVVQRIDNLDLLPYVWLQRRTMPVQERGLFSC
ncbi:hypothetical protein EVAR_49202_1 [Eumeta japonica]|uniref:Uncharacterized protein n=1 Tax=Eumeta variegata TaxID=151549 RepID=A0A4C1XRV0_EUMVA|nr:hypothetical protein EVAR_49202_1 [Eumeta japonica]